MHGVRRIAVLAIVLAAATSACIGGPGNTGVVWVRNESAKSVVVENDFRVTVLGVFDRSSQQRHEVAPWHAGLCSAAGIAVYGTPTSTVSLSGSSIQEPETRQLSTTEYDNKYVVVDASGRIHWGERVAGTTPCDGYSASQ